MAWGGVSATWSHLLEYRDDNIDRVIELFGLPGRKISLQAVGVVCMYLTRAGVLSQALTGDSHLQVRVVLPGESVGRVVPCAGPGRQLDTWQQEAQTHGNLQLPGEWGAAL